MSDLLASPAEDLVVAEASLETSLPSTSSSKGRGRKRKGEEEPPETESAAMVSIFIWFI